jgi:hypothetical protein
MNYDKITYIFWSIITLILIFVVSLFSNYGNAISDSPSFKMYFGWFIALVLINLFNILITLLYHYFMKDLVGVRGLKGEPGERGLSGRDFISFCDVTGTNTITDNIHSQPVTIGKENRQGSLITDSKLLTGTKTINIV